MTATAKTTATAQAQHLINTNNATPEAIHDAALACFEAGALDTARGLLARFGERDGVRGSAWLARFQSWLDADEARRRLADPAGFAAEAWPEILTLCGKLKAASQFGLARRLLARLVGEREDLLADIHTAEVGPVAAPQVDIYRQLALCTYKDIDLQPARALDEAERLLKKIGLNDAACADPVILGQGGAVYKRRGELSGRFEHLLQSLAYYRKGWQAIGPAGDRLDEDGYCAGNAAFMLDLLAKKIDGVDGQQVAAWRDEAATLRHEVIAMLDDRPDKSPWAFASLADACFALGRYDEARRHYQSACGSRLGDWQRKTVFLQAVALARLQDIALPPKNESGEDGAFAHPAWNALWPILREKTCAALDGFGPKTGLALSGGGFRAAFYHLGVLARLADADLLRQIEVISTVSGGSIVGAHYYLKLKVLLEAKGDAVTADDYRQLMQTLIEEFRIGVARNLRMRAFASLRALARMFYRLDYNRTLRLGELYDQTFYAELLGKPQTTLRDLIIAPKGETRAFSPRQDNWLRRAKVPILLINATNLNSGHSWQFAGSFMGEPPGLLEAAIDANARYARIHFDDPRTPQAWHDFLLGSAVAASSAVPGLFSPVPLANYYADCDLQLADGGVYDNQGVDTLLQESCTLILCSDGSGQLDDSNAPSTFITKVLGRASDISMARERIVNYQDLCTRLEYRALEGLLFVHLRQGLDIQRIPPICDTPGAAQAVTGTSGQTDCGVDKATQRLLSRVRTDLDSFTEVEAEALMLSGYLASGEQIEKGIAATPVGFWQNTDKAQTDWVFQGMTSYLREPTGQKPEIATRIADVKRQLAVSSELLAKLPRLLIGETATTVLLGMLGLVVAGLLVAAAHWLTTRTQSGWWILGAAVLGLVVIQAATLMICARKAKWRQTIQRIAETVFAIAILPVALAGLVLNGGFLAIGSRRRLEAVAIRKTRQKSKLVLDINNAKNINREAI